MGWLSPKKRQAKIHIFLLLATKHLIAKALKEPTVHVADVKSRMDNYGE